MTDEQKVIMRKFNPLLFGFGNNVVATSEWYASGGTFCSGCRCRYTWNESHILYVKNLSHNIKRRPRCPRCGTQLRSKERSEKSFWNRMDKELDRNNNLELIMQ